MAGRHALDLTTALTISGLSAARYFLTVFLLIPRFLANLAGRIREVEQAHVLDVLTGDAALKQATPAPPAPSRSGYTSRALTATSSARGSAPPAAELRDSLLTGRYRCPLMEAKHCAKIKALGSIYSIPEVPAELTEVQILPPVRGAGVA